jgi:simple sugar transport system ATP-binding protein
MNDVTLLTMTGIRKSFGTLVALNDVNFQLQRREIHGLLGGNGAGKTTLMNILYGLYKADGGEIRLRGQAVEIQSPRDALQHGIGMVHQHFLQVQRFTVVENIVLGTAVKSRLTLKLDEETQRIKDLAERFGLEVDPLAVVEDLPMGARQKVEILKALYRGVDVLILDEPTTSLTPQEVDGLFQSLRLMVNEGLSIVFITHKLREVLSVCDRISVLRNGQNVLTLRRDEATEEAFVRAMVGEEMDLANSVMFSAAERAPVVSERPILRVADLRVNGEGNVPLVDNVTLAVREGEILGVAGVAGNGQRELAEAILGLRPLAAGQVFIGDLNVATTPTAQLLEQGLSYIPEDRLHDGALPQATVAHNLILGTQHQPPYSHRGFLNWGTIFQTAERLIGEYNIKTSGPHEAAANLSGGNIQRLLVARAFSRPSRLLLAHNPTRGLDIPSMDYVYTKLLERKQQGMATLLISEDLDELLLMSDRIAVIYRGAIVGVLQRGAFDKYEIGRMMSGVRTSA